MTNDQNEDVFSQGGPIYLFSISQAARACGVGRSTIYNELNSGRLHSLRVGRRRLIPARSINKWLEDLAANDNRDVSESHNLDTTSQGNRLASDNQEYGSQAWRQSVDAVHIVTRADPSFSELCELELPRFRGRLWIWASGG